MNKFPDYEPETEIAVLQSIFFEPTARERVVDLVQPEDFYDERHRIIYEAMLRQNGTPLNQATVVDQLRQQGDLEKAGGPEYLTTLLEQSTIYGHDVKRSAPVVQFFAQMRRFVEDEKQKELCAEELENPCQGVQPSDVDTDTQNAGDPDSEVPGQVTQPGYIETDMQVTQRNGDLRNFQPVTDATLQREAGGDQWRWRTIGDAYKEHKPPQYLVTGLLPLPSLSAFFGAPGSLKTMVVQDLACCVSQGKPWLVAQDDRSSGAFLTKQAAVLWIDVDNGIDRLEDRFVALGKAHSVKEDSPLYYVSFPNPPFEAARAGSVNRVIDMAVKCTAKLIVFDNLGTISGGADENSSQMVAVMSGLRRIANETGAAVIVIHHANKRPSTRKGNALRGHSSIEGAVDLALLIERSGGKDRIVMKSDKGRDALVEPFSALWTYENNGDNLVKGRFFGPGDTADQKTSKAVQTKKKRAKEYILNYLKDGANQSQLIELVQTKAHVGRNTTLAAIKELENEKKIYHTGKRSPLLYYRSKKAGV